VPGDGVEVTGAGSTPNPFVISAVTNCAEVRQCLSNGSGITYNATTGQISVDLSEDPGNNLVRRPNGLYVPTGAATVTTGCGLTGDGSGSAPVRAATGTWQYGGVVVCDSSGVLRSEPRGRVSMTRYAEERTYNDVVVPSAAQQVADTFTTTITNPDPCRPAQVLVEREVDVWLVLPAGAGAATGFDGDETYYTRNSGTTAINGAHAQGTKVLDGGLLDPGASMSVSFDATVGRGSGGAYYYRINAIIRTLMISL
jgi:hypothetical protein